MERKYERLIGLGCGSCFMEHQPLLGNLMPNIFVVNMV